MVYVGSQWCGAHIPDLDLDVVLLDIDLICNHNYYIILGNKNSSRVKIGVQQNLPYLLVVRCPTS